ncbi:hypothetical protein [Novosphingobium aquimarinum]|uniref:hypothetical protein n=1 Tax=Novosphingobium aquimarinum TaxID=2682494 RepID=UPI0012EBFFB2|nr:hypothetical protein [Novosphingobium aquimarinum]
MATGKTVHYREGRPSRAPRILIAVVLLVAVAGLAWAVTSYRAQARYEAARAARLACVCRYVSGLPLEACEARMGGGSLSLSQDPEQRSVTAGYPLMPHQSATYSDGPGCQLQPWDE